MRSGHTEAAVDLCKLAGLPPVAVICELANDDGTVMVGPQIEAFAEKHNLTASRSPTSSPIARRARSWSSASPPSRSAADRRTDRLRLSHHLRRGAPFRLRPRRDRRRARRAGAPAPRRHHRRHLRRRPHSEGPARVQAGRARRARLPARRRRGRADQPRRRGERRLGRRARATNGAKSGSARRSCATSTSPRSACAPRTRANTSASPASASRSRRSSRSKAERRGGRDAGSAAHQRARRGPPPSGRARRDRSRLRAERRGGRRNASAAIAISRRVAQAKSSSSRLRLASGSR